MSTYPLQAFQPPFVPGQSFQAGSAQFPNMPAPQNVLPQQANGGMQAYPFPMQQQPSAGMMNRMQAMPLQPSNSASQQMQQYLQSYNRSLSIASQQQQQQQLQQHPQAFAQPNGQPQAFAQPNGQNPAFSGQRQLAVPSPAMPPAQPQPQPQPLQPTPPNQSSQTPQAIRKNLSSTGQSIRAANEEDGILGGKPVVFYDNDKFRALRAQFPTLDFATLEADKELLDVKHFEGGGGKGGGLLRSYMDVFIIKQLSFDDHESLTNIINDYEEYLVSSTSFLTRYFYHFKIKATGELFIIMGDLMPFSSAIKTHELDLKGSADDKYLRYKGEKIPGIHKRWWKLHWFVEEGCGCSPLLPKERVTYKSLKIKAYKDTFRMPRAVCDHIRSVINSDARALQRMNTMDYSVLIAIVEKDAATAPNDFPAGLLPDQPFRVVDGGKELAYYVGIIDFLQAWTSAKQVAHVIKWMFAPRPISTIEPQAYGEQFIAHNDKRWIPI